MKEEEPSWNRYYAENLPEPLEAVSDHYTGSSFKYINMVLHQRDSEMFSIFYRAQNICTWPTVMSGDCPFPTPGEKDYLP